MNYNLMPVKYFIDVVQTRGFISAAKRIMYQKQQSVLPSTSWKNNWEIDY